MLNVAYAEAANRIRVKLGAMVKDARKSKGLSQQALADAAGVSQSQISRLELGDLKKNDPGVLLLSSISPVLGLSLRELVELAQADAIESGTSFKPAPELTLPATDQDRLRLVANRVDALTRIVLRTFGDRVSTEEIAALQEAPTTPSPQSRREDS